MNGSKRSPAPAPGSKRAGITATATTTPRTKRQRVQKTPALKDDGLAVELQEVDALWSSLRERTETKRGRGGAAALLGSEAAYFDRQMDAFGLQLAALRDDDAFTAHSIPQLKEYIDAGRRVLAGAGR